MDLADVKQRAMIAARLIVDPASLDNDTMLTLAESDGITIAFGAALLIEQYDAIVNGTIQYEENNYPPIVKDGMPIPNSTREDYQNALLEAISSIMENSAKQHNTVMGNEMITLSDNTETSDLAKKFAYIYQNGNFSPETFKVISDLVTAEVSNSLLNFILKSKNETNHIDTYKLLFISLLINQRFQDPEKILKITEELGLQEIQQIVNTLNIRGAITSGDNKMAAENEVFYQSIVDGYSPRKSFGWIDYTNWTVNIINFEAKGNILSNSISMNPVPFDVNNTIYIGIKKSDGSGIDWLKIGNASPMVSNQEINQAQLSDEIKNRVLNGEELYFGIGVAVANPETDKGIEESLFHKFENR